MAELAELLGRAAIAEQQHRHVARQHMHGEEHDDADADEHEGELDEAPADIAPKLGSFAPPARAHAHPGEGTGRASRFNRHQGLIMGSAPREEEIRHACLAPAFLTAFASAIQLVAKLLGEVCPCLKFASR